MTSQVAVSNYFGVAVASDTVSSRNTNAGLKVVGHTNKIYELGENHKVLVLHSNSSLTNDVPAWLLVTEWSKSLPAPLETVQDYIDSFLRWCREVAPLHTKTSETEYLKARINSHFLEIYKATNKEISNRSAGTEKAVDKRAILLEMLADNQNWLKTLQPLDDLTLEEASSLVSSIPDGLDESYKYYFDEFGVTKKDHASLKKSAAYAILTAEYLEGNDSYLAFVGFGATESFPWNRQILCRGFYGGKLRVFQKSVQAYNPAENTSGIAFFAQNDAIQSFIRGIHDETLEKISDLIKKSLLEEVGAAIDPSTAEKISDKIISQSRDFSFTRFVQPLLNEVDGMTKMRLAEFAESLVGLQATAAKAQDGPATVGGFIEVATIDRSEGVRWVKSIDSRKVL
jgi:hypothetical protein